MNPREASQLRALLGSEPSSGYAFHDAGRVERVRPPVRPGERVPVQDASDASDAGDFPHALLAVDVQNLLAARPAADATQDIANDQGQDGSATSWPPLPHVPNELIGTVEPELPAAPVQIAESAPRPLSSAPRAGSAPPLAAVGGAIWQALPSVVDTADAAAAAAAPAPSGASEPPAAPEATPAAARNSNPNPWRGSLAELEVDAGAYGDARLLKYEPLVQRTAWEQLHAELSREPELSPALELLRIIARRETLPNDERQNAAQLSQDAIGALARLLRVPESSPTALLLGKRLLRKNPGSARERTPSAGLSAGVLLAGIAVGAGIGWLVTRLIL